MKWFRLKLWLARRSKRLDEKFAKEFWKYQHDLTKKITDSIDLSTDDIKFIKNNE